MNSFEDSILRVLKGDSAVGAAFLVSDRLVATCAHVVISAGAKVGGRISLRLSNGNGVDAIVEPEFWHDPNAEDISMLRLNEPLENIRPVTLGSSSGTKGHNFSTLGFPKRGQELAGSGEIIGQATINGLNLLQLDSKQVTPGFSGAPIFDDVTERVVGMVVAITPPDEYQRLGTTAFAIRSETIRNVCPDLQISDICPYRSLDVFNEEDAQFFFGRERVVQKMIDSLKREPRFLAVLGPSGSGKSSAVRAGLIPALKQGKVPGSNKWGVITIRPANQPFEQLESAGLLKSQDGLEKAVRTQLQNHSELSRLVLIVDQFEELLVSTPEDLRQKFIRELSHLLDTSIAFTIVLTLRDDFYSQFLQHVASLISWLERGLINIPPVLEQANLRAMIYEPARSIGLTFDEGLVDVIINDACEVDRTKGSARSTILPLLEFTLTQLWQERDGNQLTHNIYRKNGGVTGSLTMWADRVYHELAQSERTIARNVLTGLVHLGIENQGIPHSRSSRPINTQVHLDDKTALKVIDQLIRSRILLSRRNVENGDEYIEIIHDALLIEWSMLRKWLDEEQLVLHLRESVREAVRDWENSERDESYLIHRGKRLEELIAISSNSRFVFTVSEQAYINACVLVHEKERVSETSSLKDQLAARTSLAWIGMVSGAWRHSIDRDVVVIKDIVDLIIHEYNKGSVEPDKLINRLEKVKHLTSQILERPISAPLSSEEGVETIIVDDIIRERLRSYIEFRYRGKARFELQLDPRPLAKVKINPEWFKRSFDILIDNAVDATSNQDDGIIVVSTIYGQRIMEIKVHDNGVGIKNEIREKIFKTSISKKSGDKGTGIGLLMASTIVQSYGGNIRIESTSSQGTIMVISLPLEQQ